MASVDSAAPPQFGLASPLARFALLFGLATGVAFGIQSDVAPGGPLSVFVYLLLLGGVLLGTSRSTGESNASLLVIVCLVAGTLTLVLADHIGELWPHAFAFYMLLLLVPRGRPVLFLVTSFIFFYITIVWSLSVGLTIAATAQVLTLPVLASMAAWTWLAIGEYFTRRELRAQRRRETALLRLSVEREAERAHRYEMERIATIVDPVLMLIASGVELDEPSLRDIRVVEADVRDLIRSPGLHHPVLMRSIHQARQRGVAVLLLGGEGTDRRLRETAAENLTRFVDRIDGGRLTIRMAPPHRAEAFSAVHDDGSRIERIVLDADGHRLNNASVR